MSLTIWGTSKRITVLISLAFIIILTTMGIATACDSFLPDQKQDTNVTLFQICDSCTYVNLSSVTIKNDAVLFLNVAMDKNGTTYTYQFDNTSTVGRYQYEVCGDKDASFSCEVICFDVTPLGDQLKEGESTFYIAILIVLFVLFIIFFIIFFRSDYKNVIEETREGRFVTKINKSKYIKIFAFWISYGLFMWILNTVAGMANNYVFFSGLQGIISSLYVFFSVLGYGLSIGIVMLLFYHSWKDIVLNKTILREGRAFLNS